ncbi:MAG: hypothetical protein NWF01_10860 [Candidatus Bathyarchaeota archaeon]|nr:hypothetical protein [Candidatus Bathyarchaeota archaeon]
MARKIHVWQVALFTVLLLATVFFGLATHVSAQENENLWITVKPVGDAEFYTPAGSIWTLKFEAFWSYGANAGKPVLNATVDILVSGQISGPDNLPNNSPVTRSFNTTSGTFRFNYSSTEEDILTFTPVQIKTSDGQVFNSETTNINGVQAVGLKGDQAKVWYDTFHVSLLSYNTDIPEKISATFNITYLLLPENGLTLPTQTIYSAQSFLPKIIHDANVTVNGVPATEIQNGIYTAEVSTFFPTAYVIVKVSQDGWVTTGTGFDFPHNANQPLWSNIGFAALAVIAALTLLGIFWLHRTQKPLKQLIRPFLGGVLLLVSSLVSVYWSAVGVEASLHGFNWAVLVILCVISIVLGITGALFCFRRVRQTFVFIFLSVSLAVNVAFVKFALDGYFLSTPWLLMGLTLFSAVLSLLLIGNSEKQFAG